MSKQIIFENINNIKVKSYNNKDKTYKLQIEIDEKSDSIIEKSFKLNIDWNKVKNAFKKLKNEFNKNIYRKLVYDLSIHLIIKDKKYSDAKKFLNGLKFNKNIRKISDVQIFFNELLKHKDTDNKDAINCIFSYLFDILE